MTNPRDTGRWDAIAQEYVDQQVRVDFAWGNIPMQPNDDRGEATLDSELDSHIIATSGYEGFPAFITGGIYDDLVPNAVMPNVMNLLQAAAETAIEAVGLVPVSTTSTSGATAQNDGKVFGQTTPGTVLNAGSNVYLDVYDYVAPTANPIAGMRTGVLPPGWTINSGEIVMYLLGRTVKPTVGQTIHVEGTGVTDHNQNYQVLQVANNDSFNTGGTAVKLTPLQNGISSSTSNGGTWAVV